LNITNGKKADVEALNSNGIHALTYASSYGHLAVVQYLASKVSSINTTNHFGRDALLIAAKFGHADVVMFLISKGGDPRVEDEDNVSALTHFGREAYPRPSPEEQQRVQKQFLAAWKAGCHPDARWLRRRGLLLMLAGCGFQPLAYRKAQLKAAALPTDAKIPPLPNKTRRQKLALLHGALLGHPGLMKLVASFM
jgi:Ankyrin repeats (3 copies)